MAQVSTSTSVEQNFDPAAARATLNAIRDRLLVSKTIRAQDIRDIVNVYNAWTQHNHVVYDKYYVAYGNTYAYGTQGANLTSGLPILPAQLTDGLVAGWSSPGVYYYTVPANISSATIELAGGGGGGGGSSYHPGQDSGPGAGGGSGGFTKAANTPLTPGTVLRITIGGGGVGGNYGTWAPGQTGGRGDTTYIDRMDGIIATRLWTAEGGYGGQGCRGWGGGIWGTSGQAAALHGGGPITTTTTSAYLFNKVMYMSQPIYDSSYWQDVYINDVYYTTEIVWHYATGGESQWITSSALNGVNTYSGFVKGSLQTSYVAGLETGEQYTYNLYSVAKYTTTTSPGVGYAGNDGGAGNGSWATSYQGGNGGGVGGAATPNVSGGLGVHGFVGATQTANRWGNQWYQNQGAGGGGMAGNGSGLDGGLGGGGGGGSLGALPGGKGGNGYAGIYVPGSGANQSTFPNIAVGNNIILDDIRNLMALINAIRSHLHQVTDSYL